MRTQRTQRAAGLVSWVLFAGAMAMAGEFRPPAVPLVAGDPYFSVWSPADRLTDAWTVHWTGKPHAMQSMIRVDGRPWRLMGPEPADVSVMAQTSLVVHPTRTIYEFRSDQVAVTLTFTTPLLPQDLEALARPVTYITWEVRSADGQAHQVVVYFDVAGELTVNTPDQNVVWSRPEVPGLAALRIGSETQHILGRRGDDLRIEWGYLYAATPREKPVARAVLPAEAARAAFVAAQPPTNTDDTQMPRPAGENTPVLAFTLDFGHINAEPVSRFLMLAYDDLYSIKYFGTKLRPYWRRDGAGAADMLQAAASDYPRLMEACRKFDEELEADLTAAGDERYARIGALAYRQCFAANKLVADAAGQPLLFSKENFSNGCMATVDVIYPMAPQFLLLSPVLVKASLVPLLEYASSPRWKFPFAPHDMGTYPIAAGQVYGGGEASEENQMPVEESGNMLLMVAAIAHLEGNADFALRYWPVLSRWAEYLRSKGFDPENQLCTDDFAGHLAHNVNLSAKAILALGAYARLCEMADKQGAAEYRKLAEDFAGRWVQLANDGDHYRLAYDRAGTWSQKYNLVWDRVLGLDLFPDDIVAQEMAFYRRIQNRYGLPLDSRVVYTKLDWILWSAAITGSREDFNALVGPVYDFLNETPDRVPMTDWYRTTDGRLRGFRARPVVGGVFVRLMDNPDVWRKWAERAATVTGNWAPLPTPPEYRTVVPTARDGKIVWRYTFEEPADGWTKPPFDDSAWKEGPGGFGSEGTPGAIIGTAWQTPDIWIRRTFELPDRPLNEPCFWIHHDEQAEVYINGVLAARLRGFSGTYEEADIQPRAAATLKPGRNTIAVHCHQTAGGQYIDVGIVEVTP